MNGRFVDCMFCFFNKDHVNLLKGTVFVVVEI